jgi:hypothetical protein
MVIWHISVQLAHNQVSISPMIGRMTQTSMMVLIVTRITNTDHSTDGCIAVPWLWMEISMQIT